MSNILMVPVHLDALLLDHDRPVVEAMADFTRLPYSDKQRDFNPDTANVGEEIVSRPFQNKNLHLKAGIHLHWALPDALTRGRHTADDITFPAVPNRWLIQRGQNGTANSEKSWVVESDYLHPEGEGEQAGAVNIPYPASPAQGRFQPFRYLGRKIPLKAWRAADPVAEYLDTLTAVGNAGEPAFAAFYPNCHSVFGFYDDDYTANSRPPGLKYKLLGWYSNEKQDNLKLFTSRFSADYQNIKGRQPSNDDLLAALEEEFKWTVTVKSTDAFPQQILCCAELTLVNGSGEPENPDRAAPVDITVGNTGTEALSAYLGQTIDSAQKSVLEDQLEALYLSAQLEDEKLDLGPKFNEGRHTKGFIAVSAVSMWTIRPEVAASKAENNVLAQVTLPSAMAAQLNALNLLQQSYDQAMLELASMRRHLFSDWYKYMLCAYPPEDSQEEYPDIDRVKDFVETKDLLPLRKKTAATGTLMLQQDNTSGKIVGADAASGTLAHRLATAVIDLLASIQAFNDSAAAEQSSQRYGLQRTAGPRYWQPTEPVVLMSGAAVKPTTRHGQDGRLRSDGLLEGRFLQNPEEDTALQDLFSDNPDKLTGNIDSWTSPPGKEPIGFTTYTQQPWHPFLLEWEVEVFPLKNQGNLHPGSRTYAKDFISSNYAVSENKVELSLKTGKGGITKAANVYTGVSILTPHASRQLEQQIKLFLEKQVLDDYFAAFPTESDDDGYLNQPENFSKVKDWYEKQHSASGTGAETTAIRAFEQLQNGNFLSQSLGGFNEALLMHKQTRALKIADPLGFNDYQAFTGKVSETIQRDILNAPQPLNDFNPIRSGVMKILRLRLVDTFGQVKDLDVSNIFTSDEMSVPDSTHLVTLPPRLVQPARINFRWLSAGNGEQEMNGHPATTPICGWVLPNYLDNSLMIHDSDGNSLGSINQKAEWQQAPGSATEIGIEQIHNPYLRQMVSFIIGKEQSFLQPFISTLNTALENIDPENYAQHPDLAMLMGRPIALVRASLNLELQGLPALHHGWNAFHQDMHRNMRETNGFTGVEFPVRLGEYRQLNDGLVGYWCEQGNTYENGVFYAPQNSAVAASSIKTHADGDMNILQTIDGQPQSFSMLLDPRGKIHVTSGILPTKAIDIPPDQYAAALQKIQVTFLSTPILTGRDQIKLPLPSEPGYTWSWLEKEADDWIESTAIGSVNPEAGFAAQQEIREGWLKLQKTNKES